MLYFLGIDGGGSKTTCVLGDEENIVAAAVSGPSNIVRVGETQARESLRLGIGEVCRQAGITPSQISAICAGMAGAAREEVRQQVAAILATLTPAAIEIVGDMVIAYEAALGAEPGILVLAGTGSMAYGRDAAGRTARAGGWGYAISDEGSGHWIGVQGVAAVTRALDADTATQLSDRVLRRWGLSSCDQLMSLANASPPPDFSLLFPDVLAAAEAGDVAAQQILRRAGVELASLARTVFDRLWKDNDPVAIALMGGVLEHSQQARESLQSELARSVPNAEVTFSTRSPAEAALVRARKNECKRRALAR